MFEEYLDVPLPQDGIPSVSDLNRYIKNIVSNDYGLKNISIRGEISNFTNHVKSGHFYFTLKDKTSTIRAIMFKTNACKVKFNPENGLEVIITGDVNVFERDGIYQLYCVEMQPFGIGANSILFEQLKTKLEQKGLFDEKYKKPLPTFPKNIGVVTSLTGAALQDIKKVLARRYPIAKLTVISALVQGEKSPTSIIDGIKLAQTVGDIDVLIIGRGGGSTEDLSAFNDEKVAYEIFNCTIPTISAVGHEVDRSISDYVADKMASTPSVAAEICTPNIEDLLKIIDNFEFSLDRNFSLNYKKCSEKLFLLQEKLEKLSPKNILDNNAMSLQNHNKSLEKAMTAILQIKQNSLDNLNVKLNLLDPHKIFSLGYSLTKHNNKIVQSINELETGMLIETKFQDGYILSQILQAKKENW